MHPDSSSQSGACRNPRPNNRSGARIAGHFLACFFLLPLALEGQPAVPARLTDATPFILGEKRLLSSSILGEDRTIHVYLPDEYGLVDTTTHPVVYLLDGGQDEDFIHVVGLYQFFTFPWIEQVPSSIVVGIANTDRRHDFTFPSTVEEDRNRNPTSGGSGRFIQFLQEELIPAIEKTYRTRPGRTLIGQSLGGLLGAEILLEKPALFDRYILVSPSLWWSDRALMKRVSAGIPAHAGDTVSVYIGVGQEGATPGQSGHTMEDEAAAFARQLDALKDPELKVHFDFLPDEDHATAAHLAIYRALRFLHPR